MPLRQALPALAALLATPAAAQPAGLKVLELFQSQGCSSCPPAEANANALAGRLDVLVLDFAVTYWDDLGWRDRFGQAAFTQRQRDYADGRGDGQVFTPQVILDGRKVLVGSDAGELGRAIAQSPALAAPAGLRVANGRLLLGARTPPPTPATVWLVRYDPATRQVAIGAGENAGRTLPQRNVVVQLVRLGAWHGAATALPLPPATSKGLATAVLLQVGRGGPLVAAARL